MTVASVLWRRLDTPGHDACRLERVPDGWLLDGTAVFRHETVPARLTYRLVCDAAWRTRWGQVRGWLGGRWVDRRIVRRNRRGWTLDGVDVRGLDGCLDLDLAFTPATNLPQLRRLSLAEGQAADVPVAWLDDGAVTLQLLSQRYERRRDRTYWYESPTAGYAEMLEVDASGFVRRYPGLWEAIA